MPRARIVVLVNTSAGGLINRDINALQSMLTRACADRGIGLTMTRVSGEALPDAARQAASRVLTGDFDTIVVAGGDGSIRTVAGVLAGTGIPLGIIPLGTFNHFAKDIGLPSAITDAITIILTGETRAVDVAEVNGEIFVNNSSIGLYPSLIFERERRQRKSGLPKWTAMLLAALRVLRHLPVRRLTICAESWVAPVRSPCVFIGNNEYCLAGPAIGKRQKLDQAKLCLCIAKAQDQLSLLSWLVRAILGRMHQSDLSVHDVCSLEIRSRASRLLVALDGEIRKIRSPLHYQTRPAALHVIAPPPANR